MIEAMAVMAANRGVEDGRQLARVTLVVERVQERFALAQDFRGGSMSGERFTVALRSRECCGDSMNKTTAQQQP